MFESVTIDLNGVTYTINLLGDNVWSIYDKELGIEIPNYSIEWDFVYDEWEKNKLETINRHRDGQS